MQTRLDNDKETSEWNISLSRHILTSLKIPGAVVHYFIIALLSDLRSHLPLSSLRMALSYLELRTFLPSYKSHPGSPLHLTNFVHPIRLLMLNNHNFAAIPNHCQ